MASFLAIVIGLVLVTAMVITVLLLRRRRRSGTPADHYQRDMQKIQLETERGSKPRYTRQKGNPGSSPLTGTGF